MSVFVAVVGVMLLREVRIEAANDAEVESIARDMLIDRATGEWKLDEFTPSEGAMRIVPVAAAVERRAQDDINTAARRQWEAAAKKQSGKRQALSA